MQMHQTGALRNHLGLNLWRLESERQVGRHFSQHGLQKGNRHEDAEAFARRNDAYYAEGPVLAYQEVARLWVSASDELNMVLGADVFQIVEAHSWPGSEILDRDERNTFWQIVGCLVDTIHDPCHE